MITILLVDDQPLMRSGLRMRLELEPDLAVIGEAGDGAAALALARETHPQVVIMDIEMPIMDGITATADRPHGHRGGGTGKSDDPSAGARRHRDCDREVRVQQRVRDAHGADGRTGSTVTRIPRRTHSLGR